MTRSDTPFKRFVQIGRVALVVYGPSLHKLVVIVDVLDQNRVLVDGVANDVPRQVLSIKRVALTDFVLPITRGARSKQLKKVVAKEGIVAKWEATSWAKKLAVREARLNTTDFDRHQIAIAKRQKAFLVRQTAKSLKAAK